MDKVILGEQLEEFLPGLETKPLSRVELLDDNGDIVGEAGESAEKLTGRALSAYHPDGTNEMAADILAKVMGYIYRPYEGDNALLNPAAELGDGVEVGGIYSVLAHKDVTFDRLYTVDIKAPTEDELEDEYPYTSPIQRQIQKNYAMSRSLIKKTATEILLQVEDVSGEVARLTLTAAGLSVQIENLKNAQSASLTFNADTGLIVKSNGDSVQINGGQVIANTIKTNALYGSSVYFSDASGNVAADFTLTGASSTYQRKLVMSSGAMELAAYGGAVYMGTNLGPHLLLGPATVGGAAVCSLQGGPLVIPGQSFGTQLPSAGVAGQIYFLRAN